MELTWGDSQDGEGLAIDADRLANDLRIAAEAALPAAIAHDRIRAGAGMKIVGLVKESSGSRPDSEHIEIVTCGQVAPDAIGASVRFQFHGRDSVSQQPAQALIAIAQLPVIWE